MGSIPRASEAALQDTRGNTDCSASSVGSCAGQSGRTAGFRALICDHRPCCARLLVIALIDVAILHARHLLDIIVANRLHEAAAAECIGCNPCTGVLPPSPLQLVTS